MNSNAASSTGHAVVSMGRASVAIDGKRAASLSDLENVTSRQIEFERVAIPHTASLLRVARRLCSDAAVAEDLVQETLLLSWRGFGQFQTGTNIRAWLFKILFNAFYARGRKLRSMPTPVALDAPEVTIELPEPASTSPIDRLAVNRAMEEISDEHRSVLLLSVVEGLTCQETADVLHVPIGTVMSRLSRARVALRDRLQSSTGRPKEIMPRAACVEKDCR